VPSITSNRPPPPPDVTTSTDCRPLSSAVENCSTAVPSGSSVGVNGGDVNVWMGRDNDEQLQHAVEMSRLLTSSMFTSLTSFTSSVELNK